MKILGDFGKGFFTLSSRLQAIPSAVYLLIFLVAAASILLYTLVIPRLRISSREKRSLRRGCIWTLLIIYTVCILASAIFAAEPTKVYDMQLIPLNGLGHPEQLVGELVRDGLNLLMFLPVGILFAGQNKNRRILLDSTGFALALSLTAELLQLGMRRGTFDVDNLIFYTLGGILGAVLVSLWRRFFKSKKAGGIAVRVAAALALVLVLSVGGVFGAYHYLRTRGAERIQDNISTVQLSMESRDKESIPVNADADLIWHKGNAYRFNDKMVTLLFMGIDQRSGEMEKIQGVSGESGQADTIFLAALNPVNNRIKVIAISRDTMTEIPVFDAKGNYLGKEKSHLGLAYAYGDGKETSCQYMVDAVSQLFYGIPINGYAAFNMSTIAEINDAVGGVTVTVPEDLSTADPLLQEGATVTLQGKSAETFTRWRNVKLHDSNSLRMVRQKMYVERFFVQAVKAMQQDYTLPAKLYEELSKQMVTDLSLDKTVYLATQAMNMSFSGEDLISLKGEAVAGKVYDEIVVDDEALYELILDIFYIQETGEE